jgi:hypothetical protein
MLSLLARAYNATMTALGAVVVTDGANKLLLPAVAVSAAGFVADAMIGLSTSISVYALMPPMAAGSLSGKVHVYELGSAEPATFQYTA